jgi:hypothetical protein
MLVIAHIFFCEFIVRKSRDKRRLIPSVVEKIFRIFEGLMGL